MKQTKTRKTIKIYPSKGDEICKEWAQNAPKFVRKIRQAWDKLRRRGKSWRQILHPGADLASFISPK
jgi:hypothetical protein